MCLSQKDHRVSTELAMGGFKSPFHLLFAIDQPTLQIRRDIKGLPQNGTLFFNLGIGITIDHWFPKTDLSQREEDYGGASRSCPELPDLSGPHLAWSLKHRAAPSVLLSFSRRKYYSQK